jgi:hypothetical protein
VNVERLEKAYRRLGEEEVLRVHDFTKGPVSCAIYLEVGMHLVVWKVNFFSVRVSKAVLQDSDRQQMVPLLFNRD